MTDRPTVIAIFGVTGDLARRKLIPSLYSNFIKGRLPERLRIVGVGRREWTHDTLIDHAHDSLRKYAAPIFDRCAWEQFRQTLSYSKVNLPQPETYQNLKDDLDALDGDKSNRLYYLSVAPEFYRDVITNLGRLDMARENGGGQASSPYWRRIVIEKPFGYDLATAQSLNRTVHSVFQESQVYRIDHYLGKETAQNILFMRFANTIFEPVWNRSHISNVQVTVAETVDVGTRAGYYDGSGVMRDMVQNHLLQLLSLIAMEPPSAFDADALRNEKVKVLQATRPVQLRDNRARAIRRLSPRRRGRAGFRHAHLRRPQALYRQLALERHPLLLALGQGNAPENDPSQHPVQAAAQQHLRTHRKRRLFAQHAFHLYPAGRRHPPHD